MATFRLDGADFHAMVREGLGNPSTTEVPAARIMQYVNLAQLGIVGERPWSFPHLFSSETITTVADQAEYELATADIVTVRLVSASWMPKLDLRDEDYKVRIGSPSSSQPWAWYPAGGDNDATWVVALIGTPSVAGKELTVYETICPPEIVYDPAVASTTTTSALPQTWDLPIVSRAVALGLELAGRGKDADAQARRAGAAAVSARRADPRPSTKRWPLGGSLPGVRVR